MAGHSKWKQIKHKKAATDAKRGALFTKLIREITVAAREGGGDPNGNARLRTAIDAAKAQNMPAENIERAVKKGTGELDGVTYEEIVYEGYGPGGVAILMEVTTDNANRSVAEIRHIFSRNNGSLGAANSVAWMFDRLGQITISGTGLDEEDVLEAALDAGATDVVRDDDGFVVSTQVTDFHSVLTALRERHLPIADAEIARIPKTSVTVEGKDAEQLLKLLELLEEQDDMQRVYANFDIDAEQMLEVGQ